MNIFALHFDGACGPNNPGGTASYGYILFHGATEIERKHAVVGSGPQMSNNVGEYAGLAAGLEGFCGWLTGQSVFELNRMLLQVRGDSKLVINQMNKVWKAKDGLYLPYYERAAGLCRHIRSLGVKVTFDWVPREQNTECDALSKNVILTPSIC